VPSVVVVTSPVGPHRVVNLINLLQDAGDADMPALAREAPRSLIAELQALGVRIEALEAVIVKTNAVSRRPRLCGRRTFGMPPRLTGELCFGVSA
jgi:hypothetical protein